MNIHIQSRRSRHGTFRGPSFLAAREKVLPWISTRVLSLLAACCMAGAAPPADGADLKVPQQYAMISAAIADAQIGDRIVIAAGTYSEPILLGFRSDLTFKGKGKVIIDADGAPSALAIEWCSGITFKNLTFRNAADQLANVDVSAGVTFDDCRFEGGSGLGLITAGGDRVEVLQCRFEDNPLGGARIDTPHSLVEDSKFQRCGEAPNHAAIQLLGQWVTAEGNTIKNEGVATGIILGALAYEATELMVADNVIKDAGGTGIFVMNADDCMIIDNAVRGGLNSAMAIEVGCRGNLIAGNRIKKPDLDGIWTGGFENHFSGNRIKSPGRNGLWVAGASHHSLYFKNRIKGAGLYGFLVNGDGVALVKNKAKKSSFFDLTDFGVDNQFMGNQFGTIEP